MPAPRAPALGHLLARRQVLGRAVEQPVLLEQRHQVLVGVQPRRRALDLLGDDLRLQERVVEHVRDDVVGDRRAAARRARRASARRARSARPSRIFRLTSWSEQSTPAELSMKSALMRPPPRGVLDPRAAREAEVAALAHDPARSSRASTRIASRRAVVRVGVASRSRP